MPYQDVINTALAFADRAGNTQVVAQIPTMLRLVEARVNRKLRSRKQVKRARIPTADGKEFYGLPADFGNIVDITLKPAALASLATPGGRTSIPVVNREQLDARGLYPGDEMVTYTILGNTVQIWPAQVAGWYIELAYHQLVPPLTPVDCPENWLSLRYPDAYVQGLLVEISAFVKDDTAAQLWDARFRATVSEIQVESDLDEWAGQPLTVRVG